MNATTILISSRITSLLVHRHHQFYSGGQQLGHLKEAGNRTECEDALTGGYANQQSPNEACKIIQKKPVSQYRDSLVETVKLNPATPGVSIECVSPQNDIYLSIYLIYYELFFPSRQQLRMAPLPFPIFKAHHQLPLQYTDLRLQ